MVFLPDFFGRYSGFVIAHGHRIFSEIQHFHLSIFNISPFLSPPFLSRNLPLHGCYQPFPLRRHRTFGHYSEMEIFSLNAIIFSKYGKELDFYFSVSSDGPLSAISPAAREMPLQSGLEEVYFALEANDCYDCSHKF